MNAQKVVIPGQVGIQERLEKALDSGHVLRSLSPTPYTLYFILPELLSPSSARACP